MDALDIFRKLTKGLKFNTKSVEPVIKQKIENIEPEIDSDQGSGFDDDVSDQEVVIEPKIRRKDNYELEFMDGITMTEKGVKKERKRKKKSKQLTEEKRSAVELEKARRIRNEHGIKVSSGNAASPLENFSSLADHYSISSVLIDNLLQCGYLEPTPIQRQAIPSMLEKRQILACAPTGSGKTAAFLIPLLHELKSPQKGPRALVLCPTRELSKQTYREALRLSAGTNLVVNFVPKITQDRLDSKRKMLQKTDILISTPNRLCFLMDHEEKPLNLNRVKYLIIDEADKLFEGSEDNDTDFRPQLERVLKECWTEASLSLFSATQTPVLIDWCNRNVDQMLTIAVGKRNAATDLVKQELLYVGSESGKLIAFRQLVQKGLKPPVLVFVQSKDRAKQLFKELLYDGINVDVIHADRTQLQRDNVVRSFRIGKIWVLICTELMSRGIDFRGVNLVINYDFPPSAISYVHRIGRAGRAGQKGNAVTFFAQDDIKNLKSIVNVMKQSGCEIPEYMLKLQQTRKDRKRLLKYAPEREDISTELPKKGTIKTKLSDNKSDNSKRAKLEKRNSKHVLKKDVKRLGKTNQKKSFKNKPKKQLSKTKDKNKKSNK